MYDGERKRKTAGAKKGAPAPVKTAPVASAPIASASLVIPVVAMPSADPAKLSGASAPPTPH